MSSVEMFGALYAVIIILVVVSVWFSVITATLIATAIGAVGWDWWVVTITIFSSLGGTTGGSLIRLSRN